MSKGNLKFTWDPKQQEQYGPIQKLGKLDKDTGSIINDFFDELKIKPNEKLKFFIKGAAFLILSQIILIIMMFGPLIIQYNVNFDSSIALLIVIPLHIIFTVIFMIPFMIGVTHFMQQRRTSFNYIQYKINKNLYIDGLIEFLRYKGIDMQFRVVSNSKFFNELSDAKKIIFFFKPLNRDKDTYIKADKQYCIMMCSFIYKWMKIEPRFGFQTKKEDFGNLANN